MEVDSYERLAECFVWGDAVAATNFLLTWGGSGQRRSFAEDGDPRRHKQAVPKEVL